jgi:hypothetical protein
MLLEAGQIRFPMNERHEQSHISPFVLGIFLV